MGGDGEDGLALAITIAIVAMVAIGFASCFALGRLLGRRLRLGRGASVLTGVAGGLIGIALGGCAVAATFYETLWSPPPRIRFDVPVGFGPQWVILLEDPAATHMLSWHGFHAPFHGISAELPVPTGGVVRVKSLEEVAGLGDTTIEWSDGASAVGFAGGSAPAALHAGRFVAYQRQRGAAPADDILPDGDALTAYVRAHGGADHRGVAR